MYNENLNVRRLQPIKLRSEAAMFDLLYKEARKPLYDLVKFVNEYLKDEELRAISTFTSLAAILVKRNRDTIHPTSTDHLAFACESRYKATPLARRHPLAGAADGASNIPPPATPASGPAGQSKPPTMDQSPLA